MWRRIWTKSYPFFRFGAVETRRLFDVVVVVFDGGPGRPARIYTRSSHHDGFRVLRNFFLPRKGADGGNVVAIAYLELTTWINMSALLSIGVENNILQKPWWPPQRRPPASFQGSGSRWDQAGVGLPPMSSISGTAHLPNALHCIDCWSLVSNKHIDTPFGSKSHSLWNGDCCTSQNSTDMKCCFSLISSYDFYQIFISDS